MKQIFYKSGMILAFFTATFFLCTFLISMLINKSRADIINQFSDNAKYIVLTQDNNSSDALGYTDVINVLSECKAKGAIEFTTYNQTGYILYNYKDDSALKSSWQSLDLRSETPQAVIQTVLLPYSMEIEQKPTINLMGENYQITGLDIYSGSDNPDFLLNIAGLKNSDVAFKGITIIIDADEETSTVIEHFRVKIQKKNREADFTVTKMPEVKEENNAIGPDKIIIVIGILLIGILLVINAGVFTSSWIGSKKSEIMARRICGASDNDIKRLVFKYYLITSLTGVFLGFLLTLIVSNLPVVSFFLGRIELTAGFISSLFLMLVSLVVSCDCAADFSDGQVSELRRL